MRRQRPALSRKKKALHGQRLSVSFWPFSGLRANSVLAGGEAEHVQLAG
jgi:hypothetical protein